MSDVKALQSGFAEISGARLYYEIAGDGDSVVFLHGGFLDGRMWDEQIQFFAQQDQAIRYDMRCAGKSETFPSTETYTHYQDLYHFAWITHHRRESIFSGCVRTENAGANVMFSIRLPLHSSVLRRKR